MSLSLHLSYYTLLQILMLSNLVYRPYRARPNVAYMYLGRPTSNLITISVMDPDYEVKSSAILKSHERA